MNNLCEKFYSYWKYLTVQIIVPYIESKIARNEYYRRRDLYHAIVSGNEEHIKLHFNWKKDLNFKDFLDLNPWEAAASSKNPDIVEVMLDLGFEPDDGPEDGCYPIHEMVIRGNLNGLISLINYHANIDQENEFGDTALHYAARFGEMDILKYLIKSGAEYKLNKKNQCPMYYAIKALQYEAVEYLFYHFGSYYEGRICQISIQVQILDRYTTFPLMTNETWRKLVECSNRGLERHYGNNTRIFANLKNEQKTDVVFEF